MDAVAAERAELERALDELDRQLRAVRERLADPGFRASAKPALYAEQEELQAQLRARRQRIETNLVTLLERRPGGLPPVQAGMWRPLAMHQQVEPPPTLTRPAELPLEVWHSQLSSHIAEILRSGGSETRQIQELQRCVALAGEHVPTLELILAALDGFPIPGLGHELRLQLASLSASPPAEPAPLTTEIIPLEPMPEAEALPDPRDGLTRMERLVLCAMWAGSFRHTAAPKPTSTLVEALQRGDASITAERVQATLTRLMHPWSGKHPLVAILDDCWVLTELGEELFHELNSATELDEAFAFKAPRVLPVRIPLMLAKGTDGVPPHDLGDLLTLAIKKLDAGSDERASWKSFAGPDFPTGGVLCEFPFGLYDWGRGPVVIRGKMSWEHDQASNRVRLTISELPWPVRASEIVPQLERLPGVLSAVRTESATEQELVIVELAHVAYASLLWNSLCEGAVIGRAFEVELRVNDGGKPAVMGLDRVLEKFLGQRRDAAKRRIARQFQEMRDRMHTIEGLMVAVDSLEALTNILRDSEGPTESLWRLMNLASPELKSHVPHEPIPSATLRERAQGAFRLARLSRSELFEKDHSYEPGFSRSQALAIMERQETLAAVNRSRLVQESLELVNKYEKLREGPAQRQAVQERVRGQLDKLRTRYTCKRLTMDANHARSKVDRW